MLFKLLRTIFGGLDPCQLPAIRGPISSAPRRVPGEQRLGPNQLRWCEEHFPYYGIHRAQAEAPTGVSVTGPHIERM